MSDVLVFEAAEGEVQVCALAPGSKGRWLKEHTLCD
jgi:hypothetical protein